MNVSQPEPCPLSDFEWVFVYNAVGGGSGLSITQAKGEIDSVIWEQVPSEAVVEKVKVGAFDGEYVQGMFVVKAGATSAVWEPSAPMRRLRWREGETMFELALMGHVHAVEWLERDTLIALAESMK